MPGGSPRQFADGFARLLPRGLRAPNLKHNPFPSSCLTEVRFPPGLDCLSMYRRPEEAAREFAANVAVVRRNNPRIRVVDTEMYSDSDALMGYAPWPSGR